LHAQACAKRRNLTAATLWVGGALAVASGGMGFFPVPTGSYLALIADPNTGYKLEYEVEASHAGGRILAGANLPPGALFDAMVKLSGSGEASPLAFHRLHRTTVAALPYGLMLDAGLVAANP
jgi:hypothetical protein